MAEKRTMKVSQLKANPTNPRIIKDDKFKKLVDSLRSFPEMMEKRPMVCVTDVDGKMFPLGGNMRLRAIQELGMKDIPDSWVMLADDWTEDKRKEFTIKDNASFGEWNWDDLANEWDADLLADWGLDLPFDQTEAKEAEEDGYEIPEEIKTDIVLGDLIEIGLHRLLCGDSTDSDAVARLMDGDIVNLLTDPPYGINANKQTLGSGKKQFHRGESWDAEVPDFTYILEFVEKAIIWGGNYFTDKLKPTNDWLCWHKKNDNLSFSEFELAWTNLGNNCRHLSHHWGKETKLHPTMKPIKVMEWCIGMFDSKPILDVFIGSGSTMVAAHQLNRKCYGMELDPKYCQVIIDRMRKLDPALVIKRNGVPLPQTAEKQP